MRVFARSNSAKDCRLVVQQYNEARGAAEEQVAEEALEGAGWDCEDEAPEGWQQQQQQQHAADQEARPQSNRWRAFQGGEEDGGAAGGCDDDEVRVRVVMVSSECMGGGDF